MNVIVYAKSVQIPPHVPCRHNGLGRGRRAAHKRVIARPESSGGGRPLREVRPQNIALLRHFGELKHNFVRSCNKTGERGKAPFIPPQSSVVSPLSVSGHVATDKEEGRKLCQLWRQRRRRNWLINRFSHPNSR